MMDGSKRAYELDRPVRGFVNRNLIGIETDCTVQEGAGKMAEFGITSLIVLKKGKAVGFMTQGDILRKVVAEGRSTDIPVGEIMNRDLITADIEESVGDVLEIMTRRNVKHVLVKEGGEIMGMLTLKDLMNLERHRLGTFISRE